MGTRRIVVCVLVLLCGMLTYVGISWRSTTPANVLWNPLPVSSRFSRPVNLGVGQELPDQCKGPVGVPGAKPMKEYDLLQLGPFPFFNNFRNPCWYEENSSLGMSCLPYFYLAGFPKCGTTDLWNRICMHPDVARPAHKEPGWFNARFRRKQFGIKSYAQMFARELHKSGRNPGDIQSLVIGDGSTSRVWRHDYWFLLPGNENCSEPQILNSEFVRHLNPNVKIIIMVRNPTERLYSGYYFYSGVAGQRSPTKENFHWLVKKQIARLQVCLKQNTLRHCAYNMSLHRPKNCRILVGVYHVFIADWLLRIPRDQIYIIRLEDFSADVTAGMTKVFAFLDLAQPDRETMTNITAIQRRNVGKLALRSHPMLAETRAMLDDFYRPHNQRLAELLHDRRFLWQDQ